MKQLRLDGFMVPGLRFDECTIFVLKWLDNPPPHREITEVWLIEHDRRKTCYIAPGEAEGFFRKYHTFDEVLPAQIDISESDGRMDLRVLVHGRTVLMLTMRFRTSLRWRLLNFALRHTNPKRFGKQGRTETGLFYHTIPKKIVPISVEKAELNGHRMKIGTKPPQPVAIGDERHQGCR